MADDILDFYEYRHTDETGRDVYVCIDCGCNEDESLTDLDEHEQWHRDHPHAGERQTVADLQGLYENDEYWSSEEIPSADRIAVQVDPGDATWAGRLDQATQWLGHPNAPVGDGIELVAIGQKFVPCSRRGTHDNLRECTLCAGDVSRGDARPEDCLRPGSSATRSY